MLRRLIIALALSFAGCNYTRDPAPGPPPVVPIVDLKACRKCDTITTATTAACAATLTQCSTVAAAIPEITACRVGYDECYATAFEALQTCEIDKCVTPTPAKWRCTANCWHASGRCDQTVGDALIRCTTAAGCDPRCYNDCVAVANAGGAACSETHNDTCLPSCDAPP